MAQAQLIYSFKTEEFEHQDKGPGWYVTVGAVALLFCAYFYYVSKDWFGIITLVILAGLVMYFAAQKPKEIEIQISDKGINIGTAYFSYNSLKRFWIAEHLDVPELHLESTAYLNRYITLMLKEQDPNQISEILVQFIPETEAEPETLSQKIARRLRF